MSPMSPRARRRAPFVAVSGAAAAALFVVGLAAAASAVSTSSLSTIAPTVTTFTTTTAPSSPSPSATPVTADIVVTLEHDSYDGVKRFEANDVLVGPGPELTPSDLVENPAERCGALYVDVSLSPDTITVTGDGDGGCTYNTITVTVVLEGATFAGTTTISDDLLAEFREGEGDLPPLDEAAAEGYSGTFRYGRSVVTALSNPFPVLTSLSASGATFSAVWSGPVAADISNNSAVFSFVRGASPATASGANPVFAG